MKLSILICTIFFSVLWALNPKYNYETYVYVEQWYGSGFRDSAVFIISTMDSAKIETRYDSPSRVFPTGGFYIESSGNFTRKSERAYLNPAVVRVYPYLVFSVKK